jgi:hypothetical protein
MQKSWIKNVFFWRKSMKNMSWMVRNIGLTVFVILMLIIASVIISPIVSADYLDQSQVNSNSDLAIDDADWVAQSFKPSYPILTKIEIFVRRAYDNTTTDLYLLIRSSLSGSNLSTASRPASDISTNPYGVWVTFDFSDLDVTVDQTYYMIVFTPANNSYQRYDWMGSQEDLYSRGEWYYSSDKGVNWIVLIYVPIKDFCFKTYGNSHLAAEAGGPYSGKVGTAVQLSGSATGGASPYSFAWDLSNDGQYDDATGATPSYTWTTAGTYAIGLKVTDNVAATSTDTAQVIITAVNHNPNIPSKPSGPTSGTTGNSYTFSTNTTDQDNDKVKYGWDWNGDGIVDEWSSLVASGTIDSRSHSWSSTRTYHVQVKAEDEHSVQSGWSPVLNVTIESQPIIEIGKITGMFGVSAVIKNTGTGTTTNVPWWINVTKGIILTGSHSLGTIPELAMNASKTITSSGLWGIGSIAISVQADDVTKDATAFLLGPLVLGLKLQ